MTKQIFMHIFNMSVAYVQNSKCIFDSNILLLNCVTDKQTDIGGT